ncbi:MAG TPA: hypothetical protein DDY73_07680 [Coprobacter fastidiosus]|uniref:Uncharacterized protein n=1 Tax=Coprobacter fastidiosus TaxID=1099853 RepID=A0A354M2Y4_9BACT|nr:hypothetical protein [Coprobacter fastidiosus]
MIIKDTTINLFYEKTFYDVVCVVLELPGLVRIIPGSNFFFIPVFKNVFTISAKILRNGF